MNVHFTHSRRLTYRLMIGVLTLLLGCTETGFSPNLVSGESLSDSIHSAMPLEKHTQASCAERNSSTRVRAAGSNPFTDQYLVLALHCRAHRDAPSAPSRLVSVANGSQVTLNWSPSSPQDKVKHYEVWRHFNNEKSLIGNSLTTSFLDTPPGNPTVFQYQVRTVDHDEKPTNFSNTTTPQAHIFPLTVTLSGAGGGTVTSVPSKINCQRGTCVTEFSDGTDVRLMATPTNGNVLSE